MKKILMIATGGTIASKETENGLTPAMTGEELAASVPGIKDKCEITVMQLMNIDSTNMRPRLWQLMSDTIIEHYNDYDGFVILHGTDTMAYTAAALSYLIQDSPKRFNRFSKTNGKSIHRRQDQSVPKYFICTRRPFL